MLSLTGTGNILRITRPEMADSVQQDSGLAFVDFGKTPMSARIRFNPAK